MLYCPCCGWERRFDVEKHTACPNGLFCRNCGALVEAKDIDLVNFVKDPDG